MSIDAEEFFDAVWNIVQEKGKQVLSFGWDGDTPGSGGCHWVIEFHGLYFFSSSDLEEEGPFHSLDEAIEREEFEMETPNPELSSEVLSLKELKDIGIKFVANGETISINNKLYVRQGEALKPCPEK